MPIKSIHLSIHLFIHSSIRLCIESDAERLPSLPTDLRLHYSSLIANIINSFPEGPSRLRLLPREVRHSLFFMVAGWAGSFWHYQSSDLQEQEQRLLAYE